MVKIRQFDSRKASWMSEWQEITDTHRALFNVLGMRKLNTSYKHYNMIAQDWVSTRMKGVGFTIAIGERNG